MLRSKADQDFRTIGNPISIILWKSLTCNLFNQIADRGDKHITDIWQLTLKLVKMVDEITILFYANYVQRKARRFHMFH